MADKNQEFAYISAMQDFSKSLQYFVDSIKNQIENEGNNFKDSLAASKEQATMMMEMAKELKVVSETTTATKNNTEQILDIVKGIKQEKKKGIWDKLSAAKDKTKSMAEGIKTVALMAGAILAVGTAFKIIGEVDFKSVLALAVALPLVASAFNTIGETSKDPKESAKIALSMVIMSAGVTLSGAIMSLMPSLSIGQMITTVAVSVAMGISMYAIALAGDEIGNKIGAVYAIIPIMPLMALGILASAAILQNVPEVDILNTLKAAVAVSGSAIVMSASIWVMSKLGLGIKDIAMGTLGMTIMSAGLMAMSWILSVGNYENYPSFEWAKGVGLAMLGALPPVIALGALAATGFGAIVIGAGILSMLAVAGGLAATSHIIKKGDYSGGPSVEWSSGVGMAIMAFANSMSALNPGLADMFFGESMDGRIKQMVSLGDALKQISFKVKGGDYTGGPGIKWSFGVGTALMLFANALNEIKPNVFERLLGDTMEGNIKGLISLGGALYSIGEAVGTDTSVYTGGPDDRWAKGVGGSLAAFAGALENIKPGFFESLGGATLQTQIDGMIKIAGALPKIGAAVGKDTSMYQGGPNDKWAAGVGGSVTAFATAMATFKDEGMDMKDVMKMLPTIELLAPLMGYFAKTLSSVKFDNYPSVDWVDGITKFIESFSKLEVVDNTQDAVKQIMMLSKSYLLLAKSIGVLGKSLQSIKTTPDLTGIYGGLVTLSLVDNDNLESTLNTLNDKKSEFQSVLGMIQAQSSVKIDESTFAFNKDKSQAKSTSASVSPGVKSATSASTTIKAQPQTQPQTSQPNKQETLLNQLVQLMGQMNGVLGEIADNTSQKLTGSTIISN